MPLELLAPQNHPARIISAIVDSLDLSKVYDSCKGGGANCSQPDFRTINMFRSVRLGEGAFDDIFTQVVPALNEHGSGAS